MNLKEIKEIINLMNENELAEIEVEREGSKLKIKRSALGITASIDGKPIDPHVVSQPAPVAAEPVSAQSSSSSTKEINSPMVGTFYRSPSPETPPFAELGQIVEVGQVVCIVEAMKLMNEIKSEIKGKITEVLIENAEPVEFGQTLFLVEPV